MLKQVKKPAIVNLIPEEQPKVKSAQASHQQTTEFFGLHNVSKREEEVKDRFNFVKKLDQDLITSPKVVQAKQAPAQKGAQSFMIEVPKKDPVSSDPKQTMSFGDKKEKHEEEKTGFAAPKKSSLNLIEDAKTQLEVKVPVKIDLAQATTTPLFGQKTTKEPAKSDLFGAKQPATAKEESKLIDSKPVE